MKNFFLKTGLTLLCLIIGLGSAWGEEVTYSFTPDESTTGKSASAYVTSAYTFTYEGIGWSFNQWNPNTLQVKTNQSSAGSEFNFKNTSAFPGKIKSVVITFKALTVSDASKLCFVGGTSAITSLSSGTAGTWNSTAKTLTWTPASTYNYTYFAFYQNGKAASGTNYLADTDAIVVTYESGTTKTLSSIAVKTAPTKTTYTEGENFDPAGLVITATYSDSDPEDIAYSGNESDFSFSPTLTTALTTSNTYVTITYGDKSTAQSITVNEKPKHTAYFSINGTINDAYDCTVTEGSAITFPTGLADINGKKFVGWGENTISGTTDNKPTIVESATMGTSDVTYYAVYATQGTGAGSGSSNLTSSEMAEHFNSGTGMAYGDDEKSWKDGDVTWSAKAYSTKDANFLQLRNNAILSYVKIQAPGAITSVSFNAKNASDNAYSGTIYLVTEPTSTSSTNAVGSVTSPLTNDNGTITPTGKNNTLYIQTSAGLRLRDIEVIYSGGASYSGYCTTVPTSGPTDASWAVTPDAVSVEVGKTATATISTNYDGTLSVSSNATGTATATISSKTITVTGIAAGTTTLTVTGTATSNFNAISKTISVTVTEPSILQPAFAYFEKTASVNVGEVLDVTTYCAPVASDAGYNAYSYSTAICSAIKAGDDNKLSDDYACVYGNVTFKKAGKYVVHVTAPAVEDKYTASEGYITVTVTQPTEAITTIEGIYTFAESVGEKDGEKGELGESATLTFDNWVVTGVKNTDTQVYVTDGTKGFILYGKESGFEVGDIISGTVNVRISFYHGAATVEDVKATTTGINVTKNGTITSTSTTIDALSAQNTGSVVSLQNLTWNSTDKVFSDGTNTIAYFNGIIPKDDTAPTLENGKKYNITGVYLQWNTINYDVTPHTTTATIGEIMPRSLEDVEPITVITKYKVTIEAPAHGTLVVKHGDDTVQSGDEFEEGEELQITATPDTGYKFRNWQAHDGTTHTYTTTFTWKMSASDVTLTANFDEMQDYTIAWSVNGQIVKSETLEEGAEVVPVQPTDDLFTAAVPTGVTKVFTGWVTTPTVVADATPSYVTPAATANENVTYYAVFATEEEGTGSVDKTATFNVANYADANSWENANPYYQAETEELKIAEGHTATTATNNGKYYTTDETWRFYKSEGGSFTVTSLKGDIKSITITFASKASGTGDKAKYPKLTYIGEEVTSGEPITNISGNTAVFTVEGDGGNIGIQNIEVIYVATGGTTYSDFTTLVSCEISISQYGATSFSVLRNYTMPDGITGKTITAKKKVDSLGNGYYKLTYSADYEEGSVVPAGESLVLYGEPGDYTIIYEGTPEKTLNKGNLLHGVYEAEDSKFRTTYDIENSSSYYYYKLTTKSGANFGWYYGATDGAPFLMSRDDRAYLVIEKEIAAGIRGFALEDGEEEDLTTDINNIETSSTNTIYNLQGLQQNKLQKGINIVNGKKVIR